MAKRREKSPPGKAKPGADRRIAKKVSAVKKSRLRKVSEASSASLGGSNGKVVAGLAGPMPKTSLSAAELETFKTLLLAKRRQLVGDVDSMTNEALGNSRTAATGDLSMMPIHMADIGTDNYEQEFTIGLMQNERETLKEIDAALARIKNETYGVCQATHAPISKKRLAAKPWARYCLKYKLAREQKKPR